MALADAPDHLLRWQVEMHETARDLKAEIDSKLAALQALALLARQEADRLEALLAQATGLPDAAPRDSLAALEHLGEPAALADANRLAQVAAELPQPMLADPLETNGRQLAMARLADLGLSAVEIARRLNLPLGEVELLLNLRSVQA